MKRVILIAASIALWVPLMIGCGSSAGGVEGIEFTITGFQLRNDEDELVDSSGRDASFNDPYVSAFIKMQNNLEGQAIIINSAQYEYVITNATSNPPNASTGLGGVLRSAPTNNPSSLPPNLGGTPVVPPGANPGGGVNPGGGTNGGTTGGGTTGGGGTSGGSSGSNNSAVANKISAEATLLTPGTMTWIRANRGIAFPATSTAEIVVFVRVVGRTSAGRSISTQAAAYPIVLVSGSTTSTASIAENEELVDYSGVERLAGGE